MVKLEVRLNNSFENPIFDDILIFLGLDFEKLVSEILKENHFKIGVDKVRS